MKKVLLVLGIIAAVIVIAIVLVLGYFGLVPGLSSLMGATKPRDLGMTYTQQEYQSAYDKGGQDVKVNSKNVSAENTLVVSGSKTLDTTFTDNEIMAAIDEHEGNWVGYPVSDVQVRINDDGTAELSGYVLKDRLEAFARTTGVTDSQIEAARPYIDPLPSKLPVYVKLTASSENNNLYLSIQKFEVMRFAVPGSVMGPLQSAATDFVQNQLDAFDVSIDTAAVVNGGVQFKGTIAETVETYSGN